MTKLATKHKSQGIQCVHPLITAWSHTSKDIVSVFLFCFLFLFFCFFYLSLYCLCSFCVNGLKLFFMQNVTHTHTQTHIWTKYVHIYKIKKHHCCSAALKPAKASTFGRIYILTKDLLLKPSSSIPCCLKCKQAKQVLWISPMFMRHFKDIVLFP